MDDYVEKARSFIDRELNTNDNLLTQTFKWAEEKTGINAACIVAGAVVLSSCYLLFGALAMQFAALLCIAYPMVVLLRFVSAPHQMQPNKAAAWFTYWAIYVVLCFCEGSGESIHRILPVYWFLKVAVLTHLYFPTTARLDGLYMRVVKPLVCLLQGNMDAETIREADPAVLRQLGVNTDELGTTDLNVVAGKVNEGEPSAKPSAFGLESAPGSVTPSETDMFKHK